MVYMVQVRSKDHEKKSKGLKQHLGEWIVEYDKIRKIYKSYRTSTHFYKYKEAKIQTWSILNMTGIEWTGMMKEEVDNMPTEAIPCLQSYTGMIYNNYNRSRLTYNPAEIKETSSVSYDPTSIKETSNNRRSQIRGKIIKGDFTRNVRKVIQEEIMTTYYKRKVSDSYDNIDWVVFKQAIEKK